MKKVLVILVILVIVANQQINNQQQKQKGSGEDKQVWRKGRIKFHMKLKKILPDNRNYFRYMKPFSDREYDNAGYDFKNTVGEGPSRSKKEVDPLDPDNQVCEIKIYNPYKQDIAKITRNTYEVLGYDNKKRSKRGNTIDVMTTKYCQQQVYSKVEMYFDNRDCVNRDKPISKWNFENCWDQDGNSLDVDKDMFIVIKQLSYSRMSSIKFQMKSIVRYDEINDQCLLFSNKGKKNELTKDDKLILKYYYSPRSIGRSWTYTPYQQCVYSFAYSIEYWNYSNGMFDSNGMVPIRKDGFEVSSYIYGQFLALVYDPDARMYCGYDKDNRADRKRKTKDEKKDLRYRQLIKIEYEHLQRTDSCQNSGYKYMYPDEIEEQRKKKEEEERKIKEEEERKRKQQEEEKKKQQELKRQIEEIKQKRWYKTITRPLCAQKTRDKQQALNLIPTNMHQNLQKPLQSGAKVILNRRRFQKDNQQKMRLKKRINKHSSRK